MSKMLLAAVSISTSAVAGIASKSESEERPFVLNPQGKKKAQWKTEMKRGGGGRRKGRTG